jgi:hypothetical protein
MFHSDLLSRHCYAASCYGSVVYNLFIIIPLQIVKRFIVCDIMIVVEGCIPLSNESAFESGCSHFNGMVMDCDI